MLRYRTPIAPYCAKDTPLPWPALRSSELSQNVQRVTELRDEGPHVAMVEVVVARPLAELREEDADAAEAGHAVGPAGALPVLDEPPQVTRQPAGSHPSPVRHGRPIILG